MRILIFALTILGAPLASASVVFCTATCVTGSAQVTVQGSGLELRDALDQLREQCEIEAKKTNSSTHFLATSFLQPNKQYTSNQTSFDVKKACPQ